MYKCINGWTKQSMIEHIQKHFKGKAVGDGGGCLYLTSDGRKCVVGLFIPDGHTGQSFSDGVCDLLSCYPTLIFYFPLEKDALKRLQQIHDNLDENKSIDYQTNELINWINKNVE